MSATRCLYAMLYYLCLAETCIPSSTSRLCQVMVVLTVLLMVQVPAR